MGVRVTADLKKRYDEEAGPTVKGPKVRDYQAEEKIAELEQSIRELKRRCEQLKNKNEYLVQLVPSNKGGKARTQQRHTHRAISAPRTRAPLPPQAISAPIKHSDVDLEIKDGDTLAATQMLQQPTQGSGNMEVMMQENLSLKLQVARQEAELE